MKKYLNSVEEVVKALKEGKVVFEPFTPNVIIKYKLIDGFLCNDCNVNVTINFDKEKIYTEEPEPLKFEVNKPYKTRSGHKAFLDSKTDYGMSFLCSDSSPILFTVNLNGKIRENDNYLLDIVGYWEEEK